MSAALHNLAEAAGIEISWRDVDGNNKTVSDESLQAILTAIGFPAHSDGQIKESLEHLRRDQTVNSTPLITATLNEPVSFGDRTGDYEITLESGARIQGYLPEASFLPPIEEPGYHQITIGNQITTIAVAPHRAFTLADVAKGTKIWGLAVQLYALRRSGDGGIGDFSALEIFAQRAAAHGADAVAISPVHGQFSNDVNRFGPYAPSSRTAYNVMHVAQSTGFPDGDSTIDWPAAGAAKLAGLRTRFENLRDRPAFMEFCKNRSTGLERHAIFEALQASLAEHHNAYNWQSWPDAYRDPQNPAVFRFVQENSNEVSFHSYLQYLADEGLRSAQSAARQAGMKIGLIADLAVGTDPAGSHSWARQSEILTGLEIGAPPDAINREGQSWGITAFSPRGLLSSGFSAFIEMLRHALRHAGGVRIDHVMGLARLWLIPNGFHSSQGAYLKLPTKDLIRLITLESHRHHAVILGEDLGTLPDGFQHRLDAAGIAGLRVMWFERSGRKFKSPSDWTPTAVAMTSTHDLPTVAGWWQGTDISWRNKLHMAGDDADTRSMDRTELWKAFQESGATQADIPDESDGGAAADAACRHLGLAGCMLALLPIEDALGISEQPNLPGTVDEHPNWRQRLPYPVDQILDRPAVAARLAALNEARSK